MKILSMKNNVKIRKKTLISYFQGVKKTKGKSILRLIIPMYKIKTIPIFLGKKKQKKHRRNYRIAFQNQRQVAFGTN
jgi:hypothetical protein